MLGVFRDVFHGPVDLSFKGMLPHRAVLLIADPAGKRFATINVHEQLDGRSE